ncbi:MULTISPECIES: hypothetical protein [Aphanizomenonaceae]|uniref:ARC6 IMS domain-containing protein n=1 Tax=Dolichospermum heterosporum TAC447 TaxID=747523 RepID=A0ABY5LUR4_9CYAN|nr:MULTISPECIES: hypothetical protein [Aphanizomenonaceae]MTJ31529.1 hypothetical protein [Aphanizomenon sp. UHCC 0183]UUO15758.1 hypothetical protein NG743_01470 [Dolichospermum heterosporum TAC447]
MRIFGKPGRIFLFSLSLYFLTACSQNQPVNQVITSQCPTQPTAVLETNNVKPISLGSQAMKETGMVTNNKSLGYTFTAKSGDKLVYKTNQDVCIWIYTPDNQLINSPILPLDGKYTVQLAAMGGSTTFDLGLELQNDADQSLSSAQPIPLETSQTNIENSPRKDAADFIRNHYLSLNNREYSQTRNQLSNQFKNKYSGTYAEYQQWWDSVKEIKIGDVKTVNDNGNNVTLDAELWYYMNDGRTVQDSRSRIYLIWNQSNNTWLINDKSEP